MNYLFNRSPFKCLALVALSMSLVSSCGGGGGGGGGAGPGNTNTPPVAYTVGGVVSGLSGSVVLQNNGGNDLTVAANGSFTFSITQAGGSAYAVSVGTQPSSATLAQVCTVTDGSGSVSNTHVTSVVVECVTTSINGVSVPPDPGIAGTATIPGIDTDNNDIRDDIDIFIATRYGPNVSAIEGARIAARAHQRALVTDPAQPNQARSVLQDNGDAGICAGRAFRATALDSSRELNEIYLRAFNTEERLLHKRRIMAAGGLFERSVTSAVCP